MYSYCKSKGKQQEKVCKWSFLLKPPLMWVVAGNGRIKLDAYIGTPTWAKNLYQWSQTQFLEGHSSAQYSSNQLQLTPAWKFLVILKTLVCWIRCVWLGLELNCAELCGPPGIEFETNDLYWLLYSLTWGTNRCLHRMRQFVASHLVYIFSILYILFVFYVFMCIINELRAHMQKNIYLVVFSEVNNVMWLFI